MANVFDQASAELKGGGDVFAQAARELAATKRPAKKGGLLERAFSMFDDPNMGQSSEVSMSAGLVPSGPKSDITRGLHDIGQGEFARGAHGVVTGAGKLAAPALLAPIFASPAAIGSAAIAASTGYVGSKVAETATSLLGGTEDQANLAGDVGGALAGGFGPKVVPGIARAVKAGASELAPGWIGKISKALAKSRDAYNGVAPPIAPAAEPVPATPVTASEPSRIIKPPSEYRPRGERVLETPATPAPVSAQPPSVQSLGPNRAIVLADTLKSVGIPVNRVAEIPPEGWRMIARAAGLDAHPDEATVAAAIAEMSKPKSPLGIKVRRRQAGR